MFFSLLGFRKHSEHDKSQIGVLGKIVIPVKVIVIYTIYMIYIAKLKTISFLSKIHKYRSMEDYSVSI